MKQVLVKMALVSILLTGCSTAHDLPNNIEVMLPTTSENGMQWTFSANKMTSEIDNLILESENGKKRNYKVGDIINLKGKEFTVIQFIYPEEYLETKEGDVYVQLKDEKN